jgi:hypothetical protein
MSNSKEILDKFPDDEKAVKFWEALTAAPLFPGFQLHPKLIWIAEKKRASKSSQN